MLMCFFSKIIYAKYLISKELNADYYSEDADTLRQRNI